MAKKFQAVNILVSARVASKEEFENENPIIELDCFAINSEGYETSTVDNTSTATSGVKLGDGQTAWADLPYLSDVTASLVTSWLEFEANAAKARLVTLPNTNFVYDLSEEFQNMVEENFNKNTEEHEAFTQRMDGLQDYITTVNDSLSLRIDEEKQFLVDKINAETERLDKVNERMDGELDALRAADQSMNEDIAATNDVLSGYMNSNNIEIQSILQRMDEYEHYAPVELIFSGGDSTNPQYTPATAY